MKKKAIASYLQPRWIFTGVFLFAFLLRLIFIFQWFTTPYGSDPFLDAQAYNNWAKDIASGHIYHGMAFYLAPMLPYILGLLYAIFGPSLWIASLFNALINSAACVLLSRLSYRAFGAVAAIATGILAAAYRAFIFYSAPVMKESLVIFLTALFLTFAYEAMKTNTRKAFVFTGIGLGLCAMVRGNALFFIPVILFLIYWKHRRKGLKNGVAFLLGVCAMILPITLHNAIASHDFVLLSYSDGFNAYIGHNPTATGVSYVFPPEVTSAPEREEYDITRVAEKNTGHSLSPSGVSNYWRNEAMGYAFTHPVREFQMLLSKLWAFWNNAEPYDNYDIEFIGQNFSTILSLPLVSFGFVFMLAAFAVCTLGKKHRHDLVFFGGFTLLYMVTLIPFYVTERYRLPVVVYFLPLSGAAIPVLTTAWKKKEWGDYMGVTSIALLALGLSFIRLPAETRQDPAFEWSVLTTLYEEEGQHVAALEAFTRALTINQNHVGSDAWIRAADAKAKLNHRDEGEKLLQDAMKRYPTDGSVMYNYGRMKLEDNDYASALTAFQKAIKIMPSFTQSYRGVAVVYDHYGERAKAIEAVRRGLAIVPSDPSLNEVMGQLRAEP